MPAIPSFYDPRKVKVLYKPDLAGAEAEGLDSGIRSMTKDEKGVLALFIDDQNDFMDFEPDLRILREIGMLPDDIDPQVIGHILPQIQAQGSLPVTGALDDVTRAIKWLFENAEQVTGVMCSLDQHIPFQIFFRTWWVDQEGKHPDPYTLITWDDVQNGKWIPLLMKDWSREEYVKVLGQMMIWPPHCMIGTAGAALVPALTEAIEYVCAARHIQPTYIFKGSVPQTEHYGPFEPCVHVPGHPQGGLNTQMLDAMRAYERIYVFGEAEDFCVREGMKQVEKYYADQPDVLKRICFVRDCTSLVFPDKRNEANQVLAEFESKGIKLVNSTDKVSF